VGPIGGSQTDGFRQSGEDSVDVYDRDGTATRHRRDDFDEFYATSYAAEMRRLLGLGWLLLDERVGDEPATSTSWIEVALRRHGEVSPGHVGAKREPILPARNASESEPASGITTYVLGHLKADAKGSRVS
jgi:hypothetical protein